MSAATTAIAVRLLRKYMRTPQLIMWSVAGGAIFIVLFRYIFGGSIHFGTVPYVDYLMPGMVLTSVLVNGAGTAIGVAEDRDQGMSDRLRSLPVPRAALMAGRVCGDTILSFWGTAVTIGLAFLVGFRLHASAGAALLALALCLVCDFAFLWMFVCMGLVAANAQAAQGMTIVAYPLMFVSSAYVLPRTLPGWMHPIAANQPVAVMCDAVRSLALGGPAAAGLGHTTAYWVVLSLIWATGIVAVFAPLAVVLQRRVA
jgi:ABC-2 type transport system permease protein